MEAQIITFEAKFNPTFQRFVESQEIRDSDYHTFAIIGNQSTGKSTVMNELSGTNFGVLEHGEGAQQTTKGVNCSVRNRRLIVDIEGADSQERGEDGAVFERKVVLFALAIADVIIFNIFTDEVGRRKGANTGLMSTVFEVNSKLFDGANKRRLVYFIRDFDEEEYSFEDIKRSVCANLEAAYKSANQARRNADIREEFDIRFFAIPSKIYQPREFSATIDRLRPLFYDSYSPGYLFAGMEARVPFEGLPNYFNEIWTLIEENSEINIPSQKELLSNRRCNECKQEALAEYLDRLSVLANERVELIPIGTRVQSLVDEALGQYDNSNASQYLKPIFLQHRNELVDLVVQSTLGLISSRYEALKKTQVDSFKSQLQRLDRRRQLAELRRSLIEQVQLLNSLFGAEVGQTAYFQSTYEAKSSELLNELKDLMDAFLQSVDEEQFRKEKERIDEEEREKRQQKNEARAAEEERIKAKERQKSELDRLAYDGQVSLEQIKQKSAEKEEEIKLAAAIEKAKQVAQLEADHIGKLAEDKVKLRQEAEGKKDALVESISKECQKTYNLMKTNFDNEMKTLASQFEHAQAQADLKAENDLLKMKAKVEEKFDHELQLLRASIADSYEALKRAEVEHNSRLGNELSRAESVPVPRKKFGGADILPALIGGALGAAAGTPVKLTELAAHLGNRAVKNFKKQFKKWGF
mmetsp:Transcript_8344/g.16512  ORF Transcript_8344/g.16512 Transcript_8344/m.16512 type:complete len:697 (-) Transcript_8344:19-2109(-)